MDAEINTGKDPNGASGIVGDDSEVILLMYRNECRDLSVWD